LNISEREYALPMIADFAQRWHEIEPLIDRLFEVPAALRADWLRRHCKDVTLCALVERALDNAPGIEALERGMVQWLPALTDNPLDTLPVISGYRVLRFVGAGGMASVFEAERELPGGPQTVALKLLRIDVHDADERRRFLREQGILARLQHPHIAQLLDAGFSPTGTPFLALEFVAGDNLVMHCERCGLAARERLVLFIDVSAAVEHAHRSLIVHCDLKPSNVLVGADGCVKLVDFGIAKLLTGEGEQTHTEALRLTRAYAAPEQLTGDAATTVIDVYALGVLLAELLCGLQPRRIDERIDAKASAFDDEVLRRKLGVDLHAIVQKATRPDPIRRYASVAALRDDIECYLDGRLLQARADTFAYRVFTFVKRHMFAVSVGTVIATTLAGATVVGLHEAHLARRAAQEAHTQTLAAEGEATRADGLKSFLESLFDSASHGTEANETAEELLARGRERADHDFAMQPALRVEILALVGDLERRSGHPDRAQPPLEEAATLAKAQFGVMDRRTLHIEYLLAKDADELGRFREAALRLQIATDAFEKGPNHESAEEVQALAWLAGLDERIGESAKAIDIGRQALALARRVLPDDSDALTEAVTNLGWILMDAGHPDGAEPLLREALARQRSRLGRRHADVADAMTLLTATLNQLGRYGESERLMRDALDIDASAYTRPNAHMAWHLNVLAIVLTHEDKLDEASAFYAKSIAVDQALAPTSALNEAVSVGNLALIRFRQGDYAEAEASIRDAIERKQHLLGVDYNDNGRSYDNASLAEILIARGRFDEARMFADSALAQARQQYRGAHPDVAFALTVEAELMASSGVQERAAAFAGEAVAMYAMLADQSSEDAIRARILFGEILQSLGRGYEAKQQLESVFATTEAATPNAPVLVAHAEADLARVDASLREYAAANRLRMEAKASLAKIEAGPNTERDATIRLIAIASTPTKL
jgi:tetratricopeptide (TPR) repeat protein/tRNA A-37 threonylcarbamoyl transferase component Bud32